MSRGVCHVLRDKGAAWAERSVAAADANAVREKCFFRFVLTGFPVYSPGPQPTFDP